MICLRATSMGGYIGRVVQNVPSRSLEVGWFVPDTAVGLITHPVEQLRLTDALPEDRGVRYRAYRPLPGDVPKRDRYEMLRLHNC